MYRSGQYHENDEAQKTRKFLKNCAKTTENA